MTVTIMNYITDELTTIENVNHAKTAYKTDTVFIEMNDEDGTTYYYNDSYIIEVAV